MDTPGDYTGWLGYRTTNVESPKGLLAVVPGYPCDIYYVDRLYQLKALVLEF